MSYIHFKNSIYEIDGLHQGPILIKRDVDKKDWITQLKPAIMERISLYSEREIKFNLMYVTDCKINQLTTQINAIEERVAYINHHLNNTMYDGSSYPDIDCMSNEEINEELVRLVNDKENLQLYLADEKQRREDSKQENGRRQHNYIPLIFEMLSYLSEKKVLESCYMKAKEEEEKEDQAKQKKN